jgi:putative membrane protein
MKYYNVEPEELLLRDHLAAERTHLANERTLLAYLRSALLLFITALTFLKLFEGDATMRYVAITILPIALFAALFGIVRYRKVRSRLLSFNRKSKSDQ